MNAKCPECENPVEVLEDAVSGEIVECDCGAELEILDTDPLELALAPEMSEDWGE